MVAEQLIRPVDQVNFDETPLSPMNWRQLTNTQAKAPAVLWITGGRHPCPVHVLDL